MNILHLAELKISPSEVGMLGGDILAVSGPCFEYTHDIYCRIDGTILQARYNLALDPFTVQCATPAFMRLGPVIVELSFDGGITFENNVTVAIGMFINCMLLCHRTFGCMLHCVIAIYM